MKQILTTELFGVPVDISVESKQENGEIKVTLNYVPPQLCLRDGILRVFHPPRMEKPVTESELTALRLAGLL